MSKLLIDQTYDDQVRAVLINTEGKVQQVIIEKNNRQVLKSNIYVGRVQHIEKSLNAAFVDIGLSRAGFLPLDGISTIDDQTITKDVDVRIGDLIAVQILKDARGKKGAMLTANISLSGHFVVLIPHSPQFCIGVSKRINPPAERKRLKNIIEKMALPQHIQIIVRTASTEQNAQDIKKDIKNLLKLWKSIETRVLSAKGISLIYEEGNTVYKALKNCYTRDVETVFVEGQELYRTTRKFMRNLVPTHTNRIHLWPKKEPLFHHFDVDAQLEQILSPKVTLPSGGNIVIHITEAMCTIDINTAQAHSENALIQTNLEAADEIARQIRLRNISGIIAIDFIETAHPSQKDEIYTRLKSACKIDRAKINMARINEFGVLMLTRQRTELGLNESHMTPCPLCLGYGSVQSLDTIASNVYKALERAGIQNIGTNIILELSVHPNVGNFLLNQKRKTLVAIEQYFKIQVHVLFNKTFDLSHYQINTLPLVTPSLPKQALKVSRT